MGGEGGGHGRARRRGQGAKGESHRTCVRSWPIDPRLKTRVVRYALRSRVTQSATITYTSNVHRLDAPIPPVAGPFPLLPSLIPYRLLSPPPSPSLPLPLSPFTLAILFHRIVRTPVFVEYPRRRFVADGDPPPSPSDPRHTCLPACLISLTLCLSVSVSLPPTTPDAVCRRPRLSRHRK